MGISCSKYGDLKGPPLNPISIESFYDTFVTATESNNDIGDETFQKGRQNHQNQQKNLFS